MCLKQTKLLLSSICLAGLMGNHVQAADSAGNYQVEIVAADMCCKGCAQKVAGQLYAAPGVSDVKANVENRTVLVTVSQKSGASLAQLWQAVEAGEGGPTSLTTAEAIFTLTPPEKLNQNQPLPESISHVIVMRLDFKDRAQKIANQLYAIRGVQKVNVDRQQEALVVTSEQAMSPWALIAAVIKAQERPAAVVGTYGQLSIEWSAPHSGGSNQQAQQLSDGGVQR
jgi:copper chaperone CopZ